jgi:LCP family protein required for cell wall assembly
LGKRCQTKEHELRRNQPVLPGWLTYTLAIAFVFSGIAVVIFAFLTARVIMARPLNPMEQSVAQVAGTPLAFDQVGPIAVPTMPVGQPTPTLMPTNEPWGGADRVNILMMGIDRRPGEAFISRTDSIMLISIDPVAKTASILSIPRDLYVAIPGYGQDRVNTAFVYGSQGNNPVGGAALAMQTVEYNLGVPIHHYVAVDFSAVTRGVDALGGIDVYVPYEINDPQYPDMNYGYDPLYIPAGQHHFDGLTALKYARTRHGDSDIHRAQRQQQVVLAVRSKILALGISDMLSRAPVLYQQLNSGIMTDLSLEQLLQLGRVTGQIETGNIRNEVLGFEYVSSYRTPQGASVLVLNNQAAAPLIQSLFYDSGNNN